jgi:hypothetical protein
MNTLQAAQKDTDMASEFLPHKKGSLGSLLITTVVKLLVKNIKIFPSSPPSPPACR